MWTRKELKAEAKIAFKANYWKAVVVSIVLSALLGSGAASSNNASQDDQMQDAINQLGSISPESILSIAIAFFTVMAIAVVIHCILTLFVWNPMQVGCQKFFINNGRQEEVHIRDIFSAFKSGHYAHVCGVMFIRSLCTVLWSLLLVVPGIIKMYEYRMIPFLMADHPEMTRKEAFAASKEMMRGNKWKAFVLDLSFIGWDILSAFTLGILYVFYVGPYIYQTDAQLYEALKQN